MLPYSYLEGSPEDFIVCTLPNYVDEYKIFIKNLRGLLNGLELDLLLISTGVDDPVRVNDDLQGKLKLLHGYTEIAGRMTDRFQSEVNKLQKKLYP